MTRREKLIEDYEDALFALLMDEVAQMEGEEAMRLNEELMADPQYEVPEEVQKRCRATIRREFAKKRRKKVGRSAYKVFRRVSVAAMVAAMLFTTAFATSERVRVATLNAIIDTNALYSEFRAGDDSTSMPDATVIDGLEYNFNVALEWLPDGYYITYGAETSDGGTTISYENEAGDVIDLFVSGFQGLTSQIDTENARVEEIMIQNCAGLLVTKEIDYLPDVIPYTERRVVWPDNEQQVLIDVVATDLTEEEIIRLAEGIRWGGPR